MTQYLLHLNSYPDIDTLLIEYTQEDEAEWRECLSFLKRHHNVNEVHLKKLHAGRLLKRAEIGERIPPSEYLRLNGTEYKTYGSIVSYLATVIVRDDGVYALVPYKLYDSEHDNILVCLFKYITPVPTPVLTKQGAVVHNAY